MVIDLLVDDCVRNGAYKAMNVNNQDVCFACYINIKCKYAKKIPLKKRRMYDLNYGDFSPAKFYCNYKKKQKEMIKNACD